MSDKKWFLFQEYIAERLQEISPYARSTKGSGNQGEMGDVNNTCNLNVECKQSGKIKNMPVKLDWWKHVVDEIPFHSNRLPLLALQNCDEKRFAVLDLDDFLDMYIEYYKLKYGE